MTIFRDDPTKLILVLLLIFGLFNFNAEAQTNSGTPLDENEVSVLINNLKEGLSDLIENEEQVTAITEKWDAREGLAGKTRSQIFELLFEDVKSVITDEEIAKKIWENWNSVDEETEVGPAPVETPKPTPWIKFVHNGAYIAHFELFWDEPGAPGKSWKVNGRTPNYQEIVNLPADAANIRLKIQNDTGLVWQPQREIINKTLGPDDLNKCYRIHGTTLGSGWDNNCQ